MITKYFAASRARQLAVWVLLEQMLCTLATAAAPPDCHFTAKNALTHTSAGSGVEIWSEYSSSTASHFCIALESCHWPVAPVAGAHLEGLLGCVTAKYNGDEYECQTDGQASAELATPLRIIRTLVPPASGSCAAKTLPSTWTARTPEPTLVLPLKIQGGCLRILIRAHHPIQQASLLSADCNRPTLGASITDEQIESQQSAIGLVFATGGVLFPLQGDDVVHADTNKVIPWGKINNAYVKPWIRQVVQASTNQAFILPPENDPLPDADAVGDLPRLLRWLAAGAQRVKAQPWNLSQGWDDAEANNARDWMMRAAVADVNNSNGIVLRGEKARTD